MDVRASEIARAVSGRLIGPDARVTGVVVDSREATSGSLFVALPGARTDGHRFVRHAFAKGATVALTSGIDVEASMRGSHLVVGDPGRALMALAAWWRTKVSPETIGITGSVGKTTTKDLVTAILSGAFEVVGSPRSYNNEIGVPLTVLAVRPETEALVCEIGAGAVGEIATLCSIVRPRIGVVTRLGPAHLATFGSLGRIAQAKAELVEALPSDGVAILNADDPVVGRFAARTSARTVTYGRSDSAIVHAGDVRLDRSGRLSFALVYEGHRCAVQTRLLGAHMVTPALAAIACAIVLGVDLDRAADAVARVRGSPGRMQLTTTRDGRRILDDTYNANPLSVLAALEALVAIAGRERSVAVLGAMGELGASSGAEHERIGRSVALLGVDRLVVIGDEARSIAEAAIAEGMPSRLTRWCADLGEAVDVVRAFTCPGDVVLVKASRAAALDHLVEALAWLG